MMPALIIMIWYHWSAVDEPLENSARVASGVFDAEFILGFGDDVVGVITLVLTLGRLEHNQREQRRRRRLLSY